MLHKAKRSDKIRETSSNTTLVLSGTWASRNIVTNVSNAQQVLQFLDKYAQKAAQVLGCNVEPRTPLDENTVMFDDFGHDTFDCNFMYTNKQPAVGDPVNIKLQVWARKMGSDTCKTTLVLRAIYVTTYNASSC